MATTMARLRATTKENTRQVEARGKRTGVNILSQEIQVQKNGFEDPDAFFAEARSPVEKENPVRPKFTRFSIGSVQQQQQQHRDDDMSTSTGQTKRMMGRIKGLQSPSVLSPVSTAPASPENVARQQKRYESPERVRAESPPPPMNDYEDDLDDEDDLQQQPPVEEEDDDVEMPPPPPKPSQEDGTVAEQSIVEDDFMPPGPPDSPERDDESEIPTQTDDLRTQLSADEESLDEPNDGPGYSMPTTKTPQSAKMIRSHDRKKKNKSTKKDSKKRKKAQVVDTSSDDEMEEKPKKKTKPAKAKNKYTTTFSPKGIPLPLEYETIPVDELRQTQDVNENGKPCRRSKRARCAPLAFWKNEKIQYGVNEDVNVTSEIAKIPVPKAIIKAKETPYKPRTTRPRVVSASAKKKTKTSSEPTPVEDVAPVAFDSTRLRKKYQYRDEQEAELWDDTTEETQTTKVVAYKSRVQYHKLPIGKNRTKSEGNVVGKAAQAFSFVQPPDSDYVGYIMGNLTLPPKGIKDAESVGACAQTFTVVGGQPGAIEVAYADPEEEENGVLKADTAIRFLLSPGDMFRIPPGNCYRLQNHSKTTECFMTWTIIRPYNGGMSDSR